MLERLSRRDVAPPPANADEMIAQAQHLAMARVIIGRLPDALREVFVLYELEELDGEAIGEMLAIPLGTVWSRLHAARRRFSTTMQRHLSRPEAP